MINFKAMAYLLVGAVVLTIKQSLKKNSKMKYLKYLLQLGIYIANIFFVVFVLYKIYGWYAPHVGIGLPELTYLQVFALGVAAAVIQPNRAHTWLSAQTKLDILMESIGVDEEEYETRKEWGGIAITLAYSMYLGVAYLLYIILF